jgi:hypothetical protein
MVIVKVLFIILFILIFFIDKGNDIAQQSGNSINGWSNSYSNSGGTEVYEMKLLKNIFFFFIYNIYIFVGIICKQ